MNALYSLRSCTRVLHVTGLPALYILISHHSLANISTSKWLQDWMEEGSKMQYKNPKKRLRWTATMGLYFGVLAVCPMNLLSISLGVVRSSVRNWTQHSWLTVHSIGKIVIWHKGNFLNWHVISPSLLIQKQMYCKVCWAWGLSRKRQILKKRFG